MMLQRYIYLALSTINSQRFLYPSEYQKNIVTIKHLLSLFVLEFSSLLTTPRPDVVLLALRHLA